MLKMWHFDYTEIENIHVEITNFCNAACPKCPRNDNEFIDVETKVNKHYESIDTHHLDIEIFKKNINLEYTPHLKGIHFCGCFGDAIAHPQLLDFITYLTIDFPNIECRISTNGGLRNEDFWIKLADLLNKLKKGYVVFAIDGLEDTNHLYRKNVNWKKLENNFRAFIKNNGQAGWQFIFFEHNYHQLKEVEKRAADEGFKGVITLSSMREDYKNLPKKHKHPKFTKEFKDVEKISNVNAEYKFLDNESKLIVECDSFKRKNIFIKADGTIWPCSEHANTLNTDSFVFQLKNNLYLKEKNSLYNYLIQEIFQNEYFEKIKQMHTIGNFCVSCKRTCGKIENTIVSKHKNYEKFTFF